MEWIANPQQIADGYGIDVEEWIDSVSGSTTSSVSYTHLTLPTNREV